ncbi:hypothetical protein JKP88DRAFT_253339 [Tribonema minus]|uniref:SET domain-containing protein n=1 Tax=Tribonema minus TaxID=303371 RepID=A0A835Z7N6_9STRA|nr:hypothetical protein JKP88DRAFT_253339 [Tribonema minus]
MSNVPYTSVVQAITGTLQNTKDKCGRSTLELQVALNRSFSLPPNACPVRLADSPVHGKGVFTSCAINKGSVATMYPMDAFLNPPFETVNSKVRGDWRVKPMTLTHTMVLANDTTYLYSGRDVWCMGDPTLVADCGFLGHMINDRVSLIPGRQDDNARKLMREIVYNSIAESMCNITPCEFKFDDTVIYVCMVATRDISAGEELFMPYGRAYWNSIAGSNGEEMGY